MQVIEIDGVLWDADGTLSDSEPLHFLAYQKWLATRGVKFTEEDYHQFLGTTDYHIASTLIVLYGLDVDPIVLVAEKELLLLELLKSHATPRPGVLKVLKALQRFEKKSAVASSAMLATLDVMLATLKIREYFQAIASGEEVANSKPAPDVFLLAAQRLEIPATRCLVIEDSLNGIRAAKKAGAFCIAAPCESTRGQDHSLADLRVHDLDEVVITEQGLLVQDCQIRLVTG